MKVVRPSWLEQLQRLRYSVRGKLIAVVVATTVIAVLVAGVAMLSHDLTVYRKSWISDLSTQSNILALSTAPALLFNDRETATRNLSALQARRRSPGGGESTPQRRLVRTLCPSRAGAPPPALAVRIPRFGSMIAGERIQLTQPIMQNRRMAGNHLPGRPLRRAGPDQCLLQYFRPRDPAECVGRPGVVRCLAASHHRSAGCHGQRRTVKSSNARTTLHARSRARTSKSAWSSRHSTACWMRFNIEPLP